MSMYSVVKPKNHWVSELQSFRDRTFGDIWKAYDFKGLLDQYRKLHTKTVWGCKVKWSISESIDNVVIIIDEYGEILEIFDRRE